MNQLIVVPAPRIIECRVQFVNFGVVDTIHETFRAAVLIKSRWREPAKLTQYNPNNHWNPLLTIENGQTISTINWVESISYSTRPLHDGTEITEFRKIEGDFWERFELEDFPLDIQELSINITTLHNPKDVKIIPDSKKVSSIYKRAFFTFHEQQKFKLHSMVRINTETSYERVSLYKNIQSTEKTVFSATVIISRKASFFVTNNLLIVFLITFLSLTLFSADPTDASSRLSSVFTLLLTLFAFKIVITNQLPTISYLTIIDKYQVLNIIYLTSICCWFAMIKSLYFETESSRRHLDVIMLYVFIGLLFSLNVFILYLLIKSYIKIRKLSSEENDYDRTIRNLPYNVELYDY